MKRFLCQIGVFLLVLVILCTIPLLVFEKKAIESTTKEPYLYVNRVTNLKQIDADIIILGNSRAEHYDASLMTSLSGLKCLNLGWGGHSFDFCYHVMYKTYLKNNKKPSYIIVDVSPVCFFEHNNATSVYSIDKLPYINRPEFQFYVEMCPQLSWADKILFVKYFGKFDKVVKEIKGLNNSVNSINKPEIQKSKQNKYHTLYVESHLLECNNSIIQLFDNFLDECLADGIKVILICSPMHTEDALPYFDIDGFWNIVNKCVLNSGIPIISYQDYFGNDTLYFSDPIHLNSDGSKAFAAKLIHDLDSIGILHIQD